MIDLSMLSTILNQSALTTDNSEKNQIAVSSCTIKDLFNIHRNPLPGTSITGRLSIPEYQRPYVWKERQINKLLNDLSEYAKEPNDQKPLYYLGSIILHHSGDQLHIIDGQQRLTTMLILNSFLPQPVHSTISYRSPETIRNIKFVHSYLKDIANRKISSFTDLNFSELICFSSINVTLIITKSEDFAYTFFETQNTGGVRLSGTDIAKAHHLRAIDCKKKIAFLAKRWENWSIEKIEYTISNLIKIRYWNFKNWQPFPFYRDQQSIKETIIDEFTERTIHQAEDISFYYTVIKKQGFHSFQMSESPLRQIRQPLYDGNNFLDFIHEYVELYDILFESNADHRLTNSFITLKETLLHGNDGTLFLKELFEIVLITYVSRFGFDRLSEVSLWLYRYVYSMRVSMKRNVREDSIFKFVREHGIIDKILYSYTINEVLDVLKRFRYSFSEDNLEDSQSKGKHVLSLRVAFKFWGINHFTTAKEMSKEESFDKALINSINKVLSQHNAS